MFSFVQVSHPSCAVFQCFVLYLVPVLSVFVSVFLYWVRPLVMLLTFAASAFMVELHLIGCALRLTRLSRRSLRRKFKKFSSTGFFGCAPFGRLTKPSRRSFGGENTVHDTHYSLPNDPIHEFLPTTPKCVGRDHLVESSGYGLVGMK